MYRVHYGNGQVSQTFARKAAAAAFLRRDVAWSREHRQTGPTPRVQRWQPGDAEAPGEWA